MNFTEPNEDDFLRGCNLGCHPMVVVSHGQIFSYRKTEQNKHSQAQRPKEKKDYNTLQCLLTIRNRYLSKEKKKIITLCNAFLLSETDILLKVKTIQQT